MTAKKCVLTVLVFALTVGIWTTNSNAAEKIDLKLRLKQGQNYGARVIIDQKISQTIQGQEQNISSMMAMGTVCDVLAVDSNGVATVRITYQTIQIKMSGPMGLIEYDSTRPETADANNPVVRMYAAMAGQSLLMKVTPKGKIVEVKGFDEMMQQMAEKMSADDTAKEEMKEFMKNFISEDKIKEMESSMMIAFPSQPVGIGDSWTDKESISVGFPIEVDTTYTLKARKNGVAIVDVSSKMDLGRKGTPIDMGPTKMDMQMTGLLQGTSEIDEASGWMLHSKMEMQLSGEIKIAANEQMPEPMTIPMSIEGIITVEPMEN